ncbi:MAG: hypothetical protein ACAI34_20275 [Verrucomicrobium sp.]|nr:hypothetical protein [Verrucomicrobium sp.]
MSTEEKPGKSSSTGGWVTALLAIVILYLASPGPVAVAYRKMKVGPPPKWIVTSMAPIEWVYFRVPVVKKAYDAYFRALGVDP